MGLDGPDVLHLPAALHPSRADRFSARWVDQDERHYAQYSELMRQLALALPGVQVLSTQARGLPPLQVEAAAFAWLAQAFTLKQPGNLVAVTGAKGPRVLGALHKAPSFLP